MKPSEFLSGLEKIRPFLEAESKNLPDSYRDYLGFYSSILDTEKFKALCQGYWSSLFFARITDQVNISFRIFPESKLKDWPICQSQQGIYSYTCSNNLSSFIAFNQVRMLFTKELFPYVSTDWELEGFGYLKQL